MRFLTSREDGVTLVESVIALSILAILSSFILPFIAQQRMIVAEFSSQSTCAAEISQVDSKIKSIEGGKNSYWAPEYSATNRAGQSVSDQSPANLLYRPEKTGLVYPASTVARPNSLKKRFEKFLPAGERSVAFPRQILSTSSTQAPFKGIQIPVSPTAKDYLLLESDGYTLYTPLLLKGPVAYVADLYNGVTGVDYCSSPQPIPRELLSSAVTSPTEKYFMQIEAVDMSTNPPKVLQGCERRWPRAAHTESEISAPYAVDPFNFSALESGRFTFYLGGDSTDANQGNLWQFPKSIQKNIGFRVKYTVEKTMGADLTRCEEQSIYQLPRDYHNVINAAVDFDFQAQDLSTGTSKNLDYTLNIHTSKLSNKKQLGLKDLSEAQLANAATAKERNLFTAFTNLGTPPEDFGRNRRMCTQTGTEEYEFQIRIAVKNFDKESGAILMCLDDSLQLFSNDEVEGTNWCSSNKSGADHKNKASLFLSFNKYNRPGHMFHNKRIMQGWVPCDQLKLCGQPPVKAQIVKNSDNPHSFSTVEEKRDVRGRLDYLMTYKLKNSDNTSEKNKLWGCDIGYRVALVDPNGNLSYPQDKKMTEELIAAKRAKLGSAQNEWSQRCDKGFECEKPVPKLVQPKIYFKPPPCYSCQCLQCPPSGWNWGGFFRSLLQILLIALAVVTILSLGVGALAATALYNTLAAVWWGLFIAVGVCLALNCGVGFPGSQGFYNTTNLSDVSTCADVDQANSGKGLKNNLGENLPNTCGSCGMTCSRINPPSPEWTDTVDPTDEDSDGNRYRCSAKIASVAIQDPSQPFMHGSNIPWLGVSQAVLNPVILAAKRATPTPIITSHGSYNYSYLGVDLAAKTLTSDVDKYKLDLYESVRFATLDRAQGLLCLQEYECAPIKPRPTDPTDPTAPKPPLAAFSLIRQDLQLTEVSPSGSFTSKVVQDVAKNSCVGLHVEVEPVYSLSPRIYTLSELQSAQNPPMPSGNKCVSMGQSLVPNFLNPVNGIEFLQAQPTAYGVNFQYGQPFQPDTECGELIGAGNAQTLKIESSSRKFGRFIPGVCADSIPAVNGRRFAAARVSEVDTSNCNSSGVCQKRSCYLACEFPQRTDLSALTDPNQSVQFKLYEPYNKSLHGQIPLCQSLQTMKFDRVVGP